MACGDLVNSEERITLRLLKAFLEDLSKCPLDSRDVLMSNIRGDLLQVVSSPCFGYISKLFDTLVQEGNWQLLYCLTNLLDWLPLGKVRFVCFHAIVNYYYVLQKKLVSSMELYQRVKKFGQSNLPWKVSCKVHKDLLFSKYGAQKLHEKWKFLMNPGDFVKSESKYVRNGMTKNISKHRESYGVARKVFKERPSLGSFERQATPKKKSRRVTFPPDERLVSVKYIDALCSNQQRCETNHLNNSTELPIQKYDKTVRCLVFDGEIAWFPPSRLNVETYAPMYVETMICTGDQTFESISIQKKDGVDLRQQNFYLKDFHDGLCIEIPLTSLNY